MALYHLSSRRRFVVFNSASIAISAVTSVFTTALFALLSRRRSSWCGAATIAGGRWILGKQRLKSLATWYQMMDM